MGSRALASLGLVGLMTLAACGAGDGVSAPVATPSVTVTSTPTPSGSPTPTAAPDTPTPPAATQSPGQIVTPVPSEIRSVADAQQLQPADLAAYAEQQFRRFGGADCTAPIKAELVLEKMRVADLVTGSAHECGGGGGVFLWGKVDGQWKAIFEGQGVPQCADLRDAGATSIPKDFVGSECVDATGKLVPYSAQSATNAQRTTTTRPAAAEGPCPVTDSMRQALLDKDLQAYANNPTLKAECSGDWVQLKPNAPGPVLLRRSGDGWEFYTSFPSNLCLADYRAAGGPEVFESSFRPC